MSSSGSRGHGSRVATPPDDELLAHALLRARGRFLDYELERHPAFARFAKAGAKIRAADDVRDVIWGRAREPSAIRSLRTRLREMQREQERCTAEALAQLRDLKYEIKLLENDLRQAGFLGGVAGETELQANTDTPSAEMDASRGDKAA